MLALVMFLAFLLLPVVEIYVIIQVGAVIGGWQTAALLLAESLLGAWIMRREGRRAWRALRETFGRGDMPDRELFDAALVLVGGALLLTPGFVTDVAGFLFVLPFTRPLVRRVLARYATRRMALAEQRMAARMNAVFPDGMGGPGTGGFGAGGFGTGNGPVPPKRQDGHVVRGEVIREDGPAER